MIIEVIFLLYQCYEKSLVVKTKKNYVGIYISIGTTIDCYGRYYQKIIRQSEMV